jgi:hypothetical protein
MSTNRERYIGNRGQALIRVTCSAGHTATWYDQGLGRATAAAWETRHQDCKADEAEATAAVQEDLGRRWRYEG